MSKQKDTTQGSQPETSDIKTVTKAVRTRTVVTTEVSMLKHPMEYLAFVEWFSLPTMLRDPATQKEFAKQHSVNEDTITDWKKRDGFYEQVSKERRRYFADRTGDVIHALYVHFLKKGGAAEAKLFLQYVNELKEDGDGTLQLSPELSKALEKVHKILP